MEGQGPPNITVTSSRGTSRSRKEPTQLLKEDSREVKGKGRVFIEYTTTEEDLIAHLENVSRRYFIAGLNRNKYTEPPAVAMQKLSTTSAVFLNGVQKTMRDFRNWRNGILQRCERFLNDYMEQNPDAATVISFQKLREIINADYEPHWNSNIFHFAVRVVDLGKISDLGNDFLRCK